MINNTWIVIGAASSFLSVAIGAFGAHALTGKLDEKALAVFSTANEYQFYHSLALILFGLFYMFKSQINIDATISNSPGICFLLGILFFSGSLYALALSGVKILGAITPIGGIFFLIGWILFSLQALK